MIDKEFEIDVTKCIHFDKSDIPNGCTCYWDGECNHDCYFKKYMRVEHKCKELLKSNKQSKKVNDKLKEELASTKGLLNTTSRSYGEVLFELNRLHDELDSKVNIIQEQNEIIETYKNSNAEK